MFAGPIIAREVLTAPRPPRFYVARASYIGFLFVLMWTAWQSLIGWREVSEFGVIARFSGILFQVFVLLQLTLMLFFAPLAAATAIAHEKDRRTFILLLMTDLRDTEIVLGKLVASLLQIGTLLATGAPVLFLCMLLGGVSPGQIVDVLAVIAAAGVAGGALGLLVALGRDRTFQSLALTVLLVVLVLAGVEAVGFAFPRLGLFGVPLAAGLNPYRVVLEGVRASEAVPSGPVRPSVLFVGVALVVATALLAVAVLMLRRWNPGRNEPREQRDGADAETLTQVDEAVSVAVGAGAGTGLHVPRRTHQRTIQAARPYRRPWDNPVLWRELKTRAYGTKPLVIKGAYLLAFLLGVASLSLGPDVERDPWRPSWVLGLLGVLSLVLVNAQGVTALTSERDTGALDLLLVTELSPREFIYGKLYGVLYNAKEMIALPVLLVCGLTVVGVMSLETAFYTIVDFLLLCHFAAMLGLHAALTYTNSRAAVANSLGTIFFLMVGIFICAGLIIMSDRDFGRQLLSFLIFIGAGSVALFGSLGAKNPSRAIGLVALLTPFCSFYCIISFLNGDILAAVLVSAGVYGFALLAMLVPAVGDFDVALGRTSAIQG